MLRIDILAVGQLKQGPLHALCKDYQSKINWRLTIHETQSRHKAPKAMQGDEHEKLERLIVSGSFVIAMDERGKEIQSRGFAQHFQNFQNTGTSHIQCIIGGADGLSDALRKRANLLLSFGRQTWPHMLARVMLLEQIYRAQQILAGHPYHRD